MIACYHTDCARSGALAHACAVATAAPPVVGAAVIGSSAWAPPGARSVAESASWAVSVSWAGSLARAVSVSGARSLARAGSVPWARSLSWAGARSGSWAASRSGAR